MARQEKRGISRREFISLLENGKLCGAWLMEGEDDNLRDEALDHIKKALLADGMESLDSVTLTAPDTDELIAACETLPFMSPMRLVILRDQSGLSGKTEADDSFCDYMAKVPSTCLALIVSHGTADRRKKLPKAMDKLGHVVRFDPMGESELLQWVNERFSARGLTCDPKAVRELLSISGMDSTLLSGEIDKLSAAAGEENIISVELVQQAATRTGEYNVFRMVDAIITGRAAEAVILMRDLLTDGEDPLGLLSMLLRQYRLLQNIKIFQHEKISRASYEQKLSLPSFQVDRLVAQASKLSGHEVKEALDLCLDTEYRVKSGQIQDRAGLEAAFIRIMNSHSVIRAKQ